MMGGYPGGPNVYRFTTGSDIRRRFAERRLVDDIDEVAGEKVTLQLRQENFSQGPDDVYAVMWSAAGGFGDPMDRDPALVCEDVENRDVTVKAAREIYGVVLDASGAVDAEATRRLRAESRAARVKSGGRKLDGSVVFGATENMVVRLGADGPHFCCARCSADLGPTHANYKHSCIREDNPIERSNPLLGDSARYIDAQPVFRQFYCPGCGGLVENEVAVAEDDVLQDIELGSTTMPQRQAAE
jgi:N-methylhydantoinase B